MPRRANGPRRADGISRLGEIDFVLAKACLALSRTRWPYAKTVFFTVSDVGPYFGRLPDAGYLCTRENVSRHRCIEWSVGPIITYRRERRHLDTASVSGTKPRVKPRVDNAVLLA